MTGYSAATDGLPNGPLLPNIPADQLTAQTFQNWNSGIMNPAPNGSVAGGAPVISMVRTDSTTTNPKLENVMHLYVNYGAGPFNFDIELVTNFMNNVFANNNRGVLGLPPSVPNRTNVRETSDARINYLSMFYPSKYFNDTITNLKAFADGIRGRSVNDRTAADLYRGMSVIKESMVERECFGLSNDIINGFNVPNINATGVNIPLININTSRLIMLSTGDGSATSGYFDISSAFGVLFNGYQPDNSAANIRVPMRTMLTNNSMFFFRFYSFNGNGKKFMIVVINNCQFNFFFRRDNYTDPTGVVHPGKRLIPLVSLPSVVQPSIQRFVRRQLRNVVAPVVFNQIAGTTQYNLSVTIPPPPGSPPGAVANNIANFGIYDSTPGTITLVNNGPAVPPAPPTDLYGLAPARNLNCQFFLGHNNPIASNPDEIQALIGSV